MKPLPCDLLGIGNAIVDVIARADDSFLAKEGLTKGSMQLIDAARAMQLYDRMGPARELSGGSVANTVAGLAIMGHKCEFVGQVSNDQLGQVFAHDIKASGVEFDLRPKDGGAPTARSLILVTPDGQRTMNTFLGAAQEVDEDAITEVRIARCRSVFLEGYLWDPPTPRKAMRRAIALAKKFERDVIMTLSDASLVKRHRRDFIDLLQNRQVDVLFANRTEALAFAGTASIEEAIAIIKSQVSTLIVTDGEHGAICVRGDDQWKIRADLKVEVIDTTGAGDAFAAGFLSGYIKRLSAEICLQMGTICASEAISHYGPRPEANLQNLILAKIGHTIKEPK